MTDVPYGVLLSGGLDSSITAALADCEVVLVCVKGTDTDAVGAILSGVLPAAALVVSFQNGLENPARLRAALPDGSSAGCEAVSSPATVFAPACGDTARGVFEESAAAACRAAGRAGGPEGQTQRNGRLWDGLATAVRL